MVGNIYDVSYQPVGLVNASMNSGNPVIYVAINHRVNSGLQSTLRYIFKIADAR